MKLFAFEKSVGAVVFREEDGQPSYLLLHNNYWGFPKGHPEKGENEEETLRRETEEEAGIDDLEIVSGFRCSNFYSYIAKGSERRRRIREKRGIWIFKRAVFYAARTTNGNVRISFEHDAFRWAGFDEALGMMRHENLRKLFRKAHRFILARGFAKSSENA